MRYLVIWQRTRSFGRREVRIERKGKVSSQRFVAIDMEVQRFLWWSEKSPEVRHEPNAIELGATPAVLS
jgi:hypothetical protein